VFELGRDYISLAPPPPPSLNTISLKSLNRIAQLNSSRFKNYKQSDNKRSGLNPLLAEKEKADNMAEL